MDPVPKIIPRKMKREGYLPLPGTDGGQNGLPASSQRAQVVNRRVSPVPEQRRSRSAGVAPIIPPTKARQ